MAKAKTGKTEQFNGHTVQFKRLTIGVKRNALREMAAIRGLIPTGDVTEEDAESVVTEMFDRIDRVLDSVVESVDGGDWRDLDDEEDEAFTAFVGNFLGGQLRKSSRSGSSTTSSARARKSRAKRKS